MKKLVTYVLLAAGVSMLLFGCADESSPEACRHQVTKDLDRGNFDAVLNASCAEPMQKGAAHLGKAGFDALDVVQRFMDAASGETAGQGNLTFYMTAMVGQVSSESLISIDNALASYGTVTASNSPDSDAYKDASFYISIANTVKALSFMKTVIDASGLGTLNTACDANGNSSPDEVDATACSLLVSAGQTCPPAGGTTVADTNPIVGLKKADGSSITSTGQYRGLKITVSGTGVNKSGCPIPNTYNKLLYRTSSTSTTWLSITTEAGAPACPDSSGTKWPCPILGADGEPIDLVNALTLTLDSAADAMGVALPGGSDVSQSITDIKTTACGADAVCSSQEISAYLQTIGK